MRPHTELSASVVFLRNRNLSFGSIAKRLQLKKQRAIEIFNREKIRQEKENPHSLASLGLSARAVSVFTKLMMAPQVFPDENEQLPYMESVPEINEPHLLTISALKDWIGKTPGWLEMAESRTGKKTVDEIKEFADGQGLL